MQQQPQQPMNPDAELRFVFKARTIEWIVNALARCPLPYIETAPVLNDIQQQLMAQAQAQQAIAAASANGTGGDRVPPVQ